MKVKVLAEDNFRIVAVMDGAECPAETFLQEGEKSTEAARFGLLEIIGHVAEKGLNAVPSGWFHEADKEKGIYEFIKGPLRLFFFKGNGKDIAICTSGVRKSGQKPDKSSVKKAAGLKKCYAAALANKTYEVVEDETE
jgi:hypothetical protein